MTSKLDHKKSQQSSPPDTTKPLNSLEAKKPAKPTNRSRGLIVVGDGASAGGLAALNPFFDTLSPDTGMAFVVVTYLHPSPESYMVELLQKHTKMATRQVHRKMKLKLVGCSMQINSQPASGTQVVIDIPLQQENP